MADETEHRREPEAATSELSDALKGVREQGGPILTGVLVALVAAGGWMLYRGHRQSVADQASARLSQATGLAQFEEVATLYQDTPSAPIAQLTVAAEYFSQGRYELARQAYVSFRQQHPSHEMLPAAEYGLAQCEEAMGSPQEALQAYERFAAARPSHYLTPLTELGRGRCLTEMGRLDDARVVYEDFIAAHPDTPWVADAESLLRIVDKELRASGR